MTGTAPISRRGSHSAIMSRLEIRRASFECRSLAPESESCRALKVLSPDLIVSSMLEKAQCADQIWNHSTAILTVYGKLTRSLSMRPL